MACRISAIYMGIIYSYSCFFVLPTSKFMMSQLGSCILRLIRMLLTSFISPVHQMMIEYSIAGHNCFLDMAHAYHKFFGPLPSTVQDFVSDLHKSIPHVIDTKLLLNADYGLQQRMNKTSTSLASAFSMICPEIASNRASDIGKRPCVKVEVQVDDMRSSNWNSGASHEAGYDAFMIGCVFAQSCTHLGVNFAGGNVAINDQLQKHNFFIFPLQEQLPSDGPMYEFMCQTSSLGFLAKYRFDFNACIHEGVSYLSRSQEDAALNRLNSVYENWHHPEEVRDVPLVNMADILFSERMKIRLTEWHCSLLGNTSATFNLQGNIAGSNQLMRTIFFCLRPAIRLSGFTSHQLKLIELVCRKHFKDLVFVRAQEDSVLQKLIVYVESDSDKAKLLKEVKDRLHSQAIKTVEAAVGFRQVIDLLAAEKKLIVGHNCLLDMAHVYHKFFGPLPSTVQDFASDLHKSIPHVIDTKLLLNADYGLHQRMNKTSTSLASAFSMICPEIASNRASDIGKCPCVKVEVQVDDMRSSNWNSGASHEAGYGAFMTGCIFAQSCAHLGVDFAAGNIAINDHLQKYINLLYLSYNGGDIVNLSTGDITEPPTIGRSRRKFQKIVHQNVVLIWGSSKVFGIHSVTYICNLDETSVFVQFSKTELVAQFLSLKHRLETSNSSVSVLHSLSKLLEGGKTCAAGYDIYKDICSSSLSKLSFTEQTEASGINWKTKLVETNKTSVNKLMAEVHKNKSNDNVFDQIFYNSSLNSCREMEAVVSLKFCSVT